MRTDIAEAGLSSLAETPEFSAVEVPPLYCPLPLAVHPRSEEIHHHSVEWMGELGFCRTPAKRARVEACRSADWCCRTAPDGDEAGLEIYSDWINLGFMFDDAVFDRFESAGRPLEVLDVLLRLAHAWDHPEAEHGDGLFTRGFRDLSLRIRDRFPARAARNVMDGYADLWLGALALIGHRNEGSAPELSDFVPAAIRDVGGRVAVALIELAEGTLLPDAERESPGARAAAQAASFLIRIENDLYSYGKERAAHSLDANIVDLVRRQGDRSLAEAVARVAALHDRVMCLFVELGGTLEPTAGEPLRRYLAQLRNLVRGNLDFSLSAPRYHGGASGAEPLPLSRDRLADEPADDRLTAPPIPSIAWWWDQIDPRAHADQAVLDGPGGDVR